MKLSCSRGGVIGVWRVSGIIQVTDALSIYKKTAETVKRMNRCRAGESGGRRWEAEGGGGGGRVDI